MKEHKLYIEFEKAVMAFDLSESQTTQLDSAQIKRMSKSSGRKLTKNFIANMKALAAEEVRAKKDLSTLNTIKTLLKQNYPNIKAQIHRSESSRVVIIRLDGGKEALNA